MNDIIVYGRTNCMQCKMVKKNLEQNNVRFEYINIDENDNARDKLNSLGFKTVPVTKRPDGTYFTGFNPNELRKLY